MPLSEQQGAAGDQENSEDEEDGEEEEGQRYSELLFCPPQDEAVQRLFLAMNQCQMLHPDPEDDDHGETYLILNSIMLTKFNVVEHG